MTSIVIEKDKFFHETTQNFRSRIDILNQFKLDYPRMKLLIDGVVINRKVDIVLIYIWILSKKDVNIYYNFLAYCTQTVMAYPFEKLSGFLPSFVLGDSHKPLIVMIDSKTLSFFVFKIVIECV